MPIGCHGLVFTGTFDRGGLAEAAKRTKDAGYDILEISASMGLPEGADISTGEPEQVVQGEKVLMRALEILSDLEAKHFCGVLYGMLKKYLAPATDGGRKASQEVMAKVARRASELGITVSLEVVNRYEQNLFNTGK